MLKGIAFVSFYYTAQIYYANQFQPKVWFFFMTNLIVV